MPPTPPYQPRIAILGAGPAGLSTAWFLKELGYKDVLVLEKLGRVGGLACTINSGYKAFDLGANYITPAFKETRKLARAVGARTYKGSAYTEASEKDGVLHFRPIVDYVREDPDDPSKKISVWKFGRAAFKYLRLRIGVRKWIDQPDFGRVTERDDLCVPFREWLEKNDLLVFERAFEIPITMMGYGYLEEIATPYALKYLTPRSFLNLMMRGLPLGIGDAYPWPRRFKEGFQRVFQKLSWQLDVRENVEVEKIERDATCRRPIKISLKYEDQAGTEVNSGTLYFDHLVLACPLKKDSVAKFMDLSDEEEELFGKVKASEFVHITVRAVKKGTKDEPFKMQHPVLLFPPYKPYESGRPWAAVQLFPKDTSLIQFYTRGVPKDPLFGSAFEAVSKRVPELPRDQVEAVAVEELALKRVKELLKKMGAELAGARDAIDARWVSYTTWPYFGHVTCDEVRNGYYNRLEAQQGKNNTWYAGGVTNFELIEPIVCYAKALADRIDERVRKDAR